MTRRAAPVGVGGRPSTHPAVLSRGRALGQPPHTEAVDSQPAWGNRTAHSHAECGLACLAMIAGHYGLDIDLGTLRRRFPQSARGATLQDLMRIADELGFAPRAVKLPLDALSKLHAPAILHWEFNHFVVVERVEGRRALILNPEGQSRWYRFDELSPK